MGGHKKHARVTETSWVRKNAGKLFQIIRETLIALLGGCAKNLSKKRGSQDVWEKETDAFSFPTKWLLRCPGICRISQKKEC